MKDYTIDKLEKEKFIKNYKIKGDKIIINLASKEKYVIPYTKENEEKILAKMEEQVNNAKIKPLGLVSKVSAILAYIALFLGISLSIISGGMIYTILTLILAIYFSSQLYFHQAKLKDLEKQKFFLDNQKMFNDNIQKSSNMTLGLARKTVNKIAQVADKDVFDINVIDSYSLEELKKIRRNILRFQEFNFDEGIEQEKAKRLEFYKK